MNADHASEQRTRRSVSSLLTLLHGVVVDWKVEQQGCLTTSSTDAETLATYAGSRKSAFYYALTKFLDLPWAGEPITIYQDSQPCIDICNAGAISTRVKHIAVPIAYIHEKIIKNINTLHKIPTTLQPSDPGTKPISAPILFRTYDYAIGVRFYPPPGSTHASLMRLQLFATKNPTQPPTTTPPESSPTTNPTITNQDNKTSS